MMASEGSKTTYTQKERLKGNITKTKWYNKNPAVLGKIAIKIFCFLNFL